MSEQELMDKLLEMIEEILKQDKKISDKDIAKAIVEELEKHYDF
jgi:hypothetical protein